MWVCPRLPDQGCFLWFPLTRSWWQLNTGRPEMKLTCSCSQSGLNCSPLRCTWPRTAQQLPWGNSPGVVAHSTHCSVLGEPSGVTCFHGVSVDFIFLSHNMSQDPGKVQVALSWFALWVCLFEFSVGYNFPFRSFLGPKDPPLSFLPSFSKLLFSGVFINLVFNDVYSTLA